MKRTLALLQGCLISVNARRAVIKLFIADARSEDLNAVESAILEWLIILGDDNPDDKQLRKKAEKARRRLTKVLEKVANGKYCGRINLGDGIQEFISLIVLKHYAPDSCINYNDPAGWECNLIDRKNACINAFLTLIPRSLHKEGGGTWTDDTAKSVNDKIAFTDMRVILPKSKQKHQSEFKTCARDCKISMDLFSVIGFLGYATQVRGS